MTQHLHSPSHELDDLIIQEKMQVAMTHQIEAWTEGTADGIEPEIIADAAIVTALRETVRMHGEDEAEALIESLRSRIMAGEFSPERILQ